MAIIGIRQRDGVDAMLVSYDESVVELRLHQAARSFELRAWHVGTIAQERRHPFIMHLRRPARMIKIGDGKIHEHVAQKRGIENARVEKRHRQRRFDHSSPNS